jgi:carboxylesterase type B
MPVLTSRAESEGKSFSDNKVTSDKAFQADIRALIPGASDTFFSNLTKLYSGTDNYQRRIEIFGDFFVNCPTAWLASAVTAKGMPAYKLIFKDGGGQHGAESGYIYWDNRMYHPVLWTSTNRR